MDINIDGLVIAISTFFAIGCFHPIVIKAEYYLGTRCWWAFALAGVVTCVVSLFISNTIGSTVLGVVSCSCFWSILELFEQRKRVMRGWFPMNPKRVDEYKEESK